MPNSLARPPSRASQSWKTRASCRHETQRTRGSKATSLNGNTVVGALSSWATTRRFLFVCETYKAVPQSTRASKKNMGRRVWQTSHMLTSHRKQPRGGARTRPLDCTLVRSKTRLGSSRSLSWKYLHFWKKQCHFIAVEVSLI